MQAVWTWASRATGIGYQLVPPVIGLEEAHRMKRESDHLVIEVEQLDRELRRRGQLPPPSH